MINRLRCLLRERWVRFGDSSFAGDAGRLLRDRRGSLTVEAMLTLPVLMLALFLCLALIYSVHGALVLDQAAADTCRELAESSYLVQEAMGLGISLVDSESEIGELLKTISSSEVAKYAGGYLLAKRCLDKHLKTYPEVRASVGWTMARLPGRPGGEEGEADLSEKDDLATLLSIFYDEDDVVLVLTYTPAKLNRITALLPDSWKIIITKRQRAWLIGRNMSPDRGAEQAAGKKNVGPLVYITNYGVKYHMNGCRYLAKSRYPVYLNELSETYGACKVCRPPPRS